MERYLTKKEKITGQGSAIDSTVYLDLCAGISFLGGELYSGVTERKGRFLPVCSDRSDSTFCLFCVFSDFADYKYKT